MNQNDSLEQTHQTLVEHLVELRFRLVRSAWAILIGMVACYNFTTDIFDIIRKPIAPYLPTGGLIFNAPADKFIAHLKIAFFGGLILSCPFWIYQIWKFVSPGLYTKEKKYTLGFIVSGSVLFIIGILFSYFFVMPTAFEFLMGYGGKTDQAMITIDAYLSFFLTTTLMFGLSFEMPLIIVILGMLGLVSSKFLREKRRFSIVGMSVLAAVITPPDLLSMSMMLIPMLVLYEISIILVRFFELRSKDLQT
jgi:sec-independent protein translocase protein TatC